LIIQGVGGDTPATKGAEGTPTSPIGEGKDRPQPYLLHPRVGQARARVRSYSPTFGKERIDPNPIPPPGWPGAGWEGIDPLSPERAGIS